MGSGTSASGPNNWNTRSGIGCMVPPASTTALASATTSRKCLAGLRRMNLRLDSPTLRGLWESRRRPSASALVSERRKASTAPMAGRERPSTSISSPSSEMCTCTSDDSYFSTNPFSFLTISERWMYFSILKRFMLSILVAKRKSLLVLICVFSSDSWVAWCVKVGRASEDEVAATAAPAAPADADAGHACGFWRSLMKARTITRIWRI